MSFIHPILEYATQVWDPCQKTIIHKIEIYKGEQQDGFTQIMIIVAVFQLCWMTLTGPRLKIDAKKTGYHYYTESSSIKNQP